MYKRLIFVALFFNLAGSGSVLAQADYRDEIERFSAAGDWTGLRSYLTARPELLTGDSPDTPELQRFLSAASGLYAALTIRAEDFPELSEPVEPLVLARPTPRSMKLTGITDTAKHDASVATTPKPKKQAAKAKNRASKPKVIKTALRKQKAEPRASRAKTPKMRLASLSKKTNRASSRLYARNEDHGCR